MTGLFGERRRIAQTALEIPVFGMGTAHLGELYGKVEEAASQATLAAAWEAGVRYFDTAPWYGRGLAEHRLGGFLRGLPRADFLVSTKVGRSLHRPADPSRFDRGPWVGGLNFEVRFDYSRDGVMRAYEQALQRLALDTVDALVIHDLDAAYHDAEGMLRHARDLEGSGMAALEELKAAGDIKAVGIGINTGEQLATLPEALALDFALVAMPYTLLDQASLTTGMKLCEDRGISVIIGAPLASGILATGAARGATYGYGAASEAVLDKVRGIEAVCAAHSVPLIAAALQFPLAHPAVAGIIPGAARPQEIAANVAALETAIPAAFWADLKAGGLIDAAAPVPGGAA